MFKDFLRIYIKAGDGGNGIVSFTKEKGKKKKPDGGNGGFGGDIIFKATKHLNNLNCYSNKQVFKAEDGFDGRSNKRNGKSGESKTILVPVGCVILDKNKNYLSDLDVDQEEFLFQKGQKGGLGNYSISKLKKIYDIAWNGKKNEVEEVNLSLKLIADVGLIGFPNVGKSSLLEKLSNAKPKIANYPFTTLQPNLGKLKTDKKNVIIADLPGLSEEAHLNKGLGFQFLKHIERCKIIAFVLEVKEDIKEMEKAYNQLNFILNSYNKNFNKVKNFIILSKADLLKEDKTEYLKKINKLFLNQKTILVSSKDNYNINNVVEVILSFENIKRLESINHFYKEENKVRYYNLKEEVVDFSYYKLKKNHWKINSNYIKNIISSYDFSNHNHVLLFNKKLEKIGFFEWLKKQTTIKEKDIIEIYGFVFENVI